MKNLIIVGVVLFLVIGQLSANPLSVFTGAEEGPPKCTEDTTFFQGCKDCKSLKFCLGNQLVYLDCSIQSNGAKPYCNSTSKSCQQEQIDCSTNGSPEFTCPELDGFYPDPLNCKKFYECYQNETYPSECKIGTVFNPKGPNCQSGITCYSFSTQNGLCKGKIGQTVLHPLDKNIYVECESFPIVLKCPTDNIYDLTSKSCIYDCKTAGTYPDFDNDEFYYVCVREGLSWVASHEQCPPGQFFDLKFGGCRRRPAPSG